MVNLSTHPVLAALNWHAELSDTLVKVYFARDGERVDIVDNDGDWSAYEKAQVMAALDSYAAVTALDFTIVEDRADATFTLTKSPGDDDSVAFMNPPDPEFGDAQGIAWFNNDYGWSDADGGLLDPGSYTYTVFLHEFGHGMGLAHPHDIGGNSTLLPYVEDGFGMDQGVYTVMSYNDGWPESPDGLSDSQAWGWNLTPAPLDIAVLQEKYGVNTTTGAGDTRYDLPDEDGPGTGYAAIWDVGGADVIVHGGSAAAVINLRAATLEEQEGGGFVSHVSGVHGGFTIAHGVIIESAIGGTGNDKLMGNDADNTMRGDSGNDRLFGYGGKDMLFGGQGNDILRGGGGRDVLTGSSGADWMAGGRGADKLLGEWGNDRLIGGGGADRLDGGGGRDVLKGGRGADRFIFSKASEAARDRIKDFSAYDSDKIDMSGIDADSTLDGDQQFVFVGAAGFSETAGELTFRQTARQTRVKADLDGDGTADFVIRLAGILDLTESDFIL